MMKKRQTILTVVFFLILGISNYAWSSVVGEWNVTGDMSVKVTLKKSKPVVEEDAFTDVFLIISGGTFQMTDMAGYWTSNKKQTNFKVFLDEGDVEAYFLEDPIVDVTLKSIHFKGKEEKDGTISGTFKMNLDIVLNDSRTGKVKVTASFTGTRAPTTAPPPGELNTQVQAPTLPEVIALKVLEILQTQ